MSRPRSDASRMQARKELLLARSAIERLELSAHVDQFKASVTPSALARGVLPTLTRGGALATAMRAFSLVQRYPVVSSAASMLLPRLLPRNLFRMAKLGLGAYGIYQGYRVWRDLTQDQKPRRSRRKSRGVDESPTDPEDFGPVP